MTKNNYDTGCFLCGKDLLYSAEPELKKCIYCGQEEMGIVSCSEGHFVCDICHKSDSSDVIENFLVNSDSVSPIETATLLMKMPGITMHGPEHHFIVPGVLLSAYYNLKKKKKLKKKAIHYARLRAEKVPGGFCGTHGCCGAGVGAGIFISMMTGANSLSGIEYMQSNLMTSAALKEIALNGGPRCCKRSTYLAITEGIRTLKDTFGIEMHMEEIKCTFSHRNRECRKEECLFYN